MTTDDTDDACTTPQCTHKQGHDWEDGQPPYQVFGGRWIDLVCSHCGIHKQLFVKEGPTT